MYESRVQLYAYMGTFVNLAHAARVSFGQNPIAAERAFSSLVMGDSEKELDEYQAKALKTVEFCFKLGHLSVFEFAHMAFWIHCPIFVARQLMRYRQASYIERSLRRTQPLPVENDPEYTDSVNRYYDKLSKGGRKEEARAVLTLSTPTEFLMSVNLRELFHIFDERLDKTAQVQTRSCVQQMYDIFEQIHPQLARLYSTKK